jgi:hypothetical protein
MNYRKPKCIVSTLKPNGMKLYACLIAALLLYGCKGVETRISIGTSNSFQFGAFENGESVGEENFQTAISFQTGFRLRTTLDSITRDNFRTVPALRSEGRSGFFNASFRYGITSRLDAGIGFFLSYSDSFPRWVQIDSKGLRGFLLFAVINDARFHLSLYASGSYVNGTTEEANTLFIFQERTTGFGNAQGNQYSATLPMSFALTKNFALIYE